MITNNTITYYHKVLNNTTKLEEWSKVVFQNVWTFINIEAMNNKGYENANVINVRIPFYEVQDRSIFDIGDIIAIGEQDDIQRQTDLKGKQFYNVTSVNINTYGNNPHIHLGGK